MALSAKIIYSLLFPSALTLSANCVQYSLSSSNVKGLLIRVPVCTVTSSTTFVSAGFLKEDRLGNFKPEVESSLRSSLGIVGVEITIGFVVWVDSTLGREGCFSTGSSTFLVGVSVVVTLLLFFLIPHRWKILLERVEWLLLDEQFSLKQVRREA